MNETYTFSRALHLMRYGGKKMQPVGYAHWYYVKDNELWYDTPSKGTHYASNMDTDEIMGSWEEVKDES